MITVEHADAYGISIQDARRLTDEEKRGYADWAKEFLMVSLGNHLELGELDWRDMPERKADGMFNGCSNSLWIITESERDEFVKLNTDRAQDKMAIKQAQAQAEASRLNKLWEQAKQTGEPQPIDRWMTHICMEELEDCSFDAAVRLAMPDGSTKVEYTHCY